MSRSDAVAVAALLSELMEAGVPRAERVLATDEGGANCDEWVTFERFLADLGVRIATVADHLGGVPRSLAASLLARDLLPLVVTPSVMAWSLFARAADLAASNLQVGCWQDRPIAVSMLEPRLVEPVDARWVTEVIVDGVCAPMIRSVQSSDRVASLHLWGNVALAMAAPFSALLATGRHDGRAHRDELLALRPELARTVEVLDVSTEGRQLEAVRRRTCCLLTKLPEPHGAMCGTCSLRPKAEQLVRLRAHYDGLAVL